MKKMGGTGGYEGLGGQHRELAFNDKFVLKLDDAAFGMGSAGNAFAGLGLDPLPAFLFTVDRQQLSVLVKTFGSIFVLSKRGLLAKKLFLPDECVGPPVFVHVGGF